MGRDRAQSRSPDRPRIWEAGAVSELDMNEQGTREQGTSDRDTRQNRRVGDVRAWVNGVRVDATGPSIAAVDHGITVGDGVFETCKVIDGVPFALARHARRVDRSLAGLGLPAADHAVIDAGIKDVLLGEPIAYGRLRYTITGGAGPLGSDRDTSPLTYIVTAGSTAPNPVTAKVVVVPWTRNERSATAGLKTTSYAENVVALAYAKDRGGAEAVLANSVGNLCEGTGANGPEARSGVRISPSTTTTTLAPVPSQRLPTELARTASAPPRSLA